MYCNHFVTDDFMNNSCRSNHQQTATLGTGGYRLHQRSNSQINLIKEKVITCKKHKRWRSSINTCSWPPWKIENQGTGNKDVQSES